MKKKNIIFILISCLLIISCYDKNETKIKINQRYTDLKFDTLFNNLKKIKIEYDSLQKNNKEYEKIMKDSLKHSFYISKIDTNEIVKLSWENSFSIEIQNIDSINEFPYELQKVYPRYINKKWDSTYFDNKESSQSLLWSMNEAKKYKYIIISTILDYKSPFQHYDNTFESGYVFGKISIINGYDNSLILEAYNYASNSISISILTYKGKQSGSLNSDLRSNYIINIEDNLKQFNITASFSNCY